jgi:hypothetical protein
MLSEMDPLELAIIVVVPVFALILGIFLGIDMYRLGWWWGA